MSEVIKKRRKLLKGAIQQCEFVSPTKTPGGLGLRCRRNAQYNKQFCYQHQPVYREATKESQRRRRARVTQENRLKKIQQSRDELIKAGVLCESCHAKADEYILHLEKVEL